MQFFLASIAIALAVSGCAVAPPPSRLLTAADPRVRVMPVHAPDANAGTLTFRPVSPVAGTGGWGQQPLETAPKIKGAKP